MTPTEKADTVFERHCGTLLQPPVFEKSNSDVAAREQWLDQYRLVSRPFDVVGTQWRDALCDIVLPGIGWVRARVVSNCR